MGDETPRVFMVCQDQSIADEVGAMFKRASAALSAVDSFFDKMIEQDEDDPNLTAKAGPLLERLTLTLMQIYPNARQMAADVKSIGDFKAYAPNSIPRTDS